MYLEEGTYHKSYYSRERVYCLLALDSVTSPIIKLSAWGKGYRRLCMFYYCRTYYKAVRVGGGGEWRTCAMRDDEPRPVWMSAHHALVNAGGREIV
jgi:hypothetical protein